MKNVIMGKYKAKTFCGAEQIDVELAMKKWLMTHPINDGFYDCTQDNDNNIVGVILYK